jgi:hypothetical protein
MRQVPLLADSRPRCSPAPPHELREQLLQMAREWMQAAITEEDGTSRFGLSRQLHTIPGVLFKVLCLMFKNPSSSFKPLSLWKIWGLLVLVVFYARREGLIRHHPGMVGDIISEQWAELSRNGWAASFRNHGRLAPESADPLPPFIAFQQHP